MRKEKDYSVIERVIYGCEANKEYHELMRESEDFCQRMVDKWFIITGYSNIDLEIVFYVFSIKKNIKKFLSNFKKDEVTIIIKEWDPELPRYKHLMDEDKLK